MRHLSSVLLLLAVVVTSCRRRHHNKKGTGLLIGESEDDIRDNVINYNEQGGGEEDEVRETDSLLHTLVLNVSRCVSHHYIPSAHLAECFQH